MTKFKRSVAIGKAFPSKMIMTHRYVCQYPVTQIPNAGITFQMRANGMYDPEVALGGHQPLCFDQMSAIYNHWTVIGSKIKWTITREASNPPATVLHAVAYLNDDATTIGNIYALSEQNGTRIRVIPGSAGTYGDSKTIFNQKFSATRQYGKGSLTNSLLQGSATADPVEQSVFQLSLGTTVAAATVDVSILVEVEYIAVWTEPKEIAQS